MRSLTSEKVVIPDVDNILRDAARNLRLSVCVQLKSNALANNFLLE